MDSSKSRATFEAALHADGNVTSASGVDHATSSTCSSEIHTSGCVANACTSSLSNPSVALPHKLSRAMTRRASHVVSEMQTRKRGSMLPFVALPPFPPFTRSVPPSVEYAFAGALSHPRLYSTINGATFVRSNTHPDPSASLRNVSVVLELAVISARR